MKTNGTASLAVLTVSILPALLQAHAATKTLDGVISDSMCGKKHIAQRAVLEHESILAVATSGFA